MQDDFDIGNVGANDTDLATDETAPQEPSDVGASGGPPRVRIERFPVCPESMREYIPCLDNEDDIKRLPSTERGERFERHCPAKDKGLSCLVPAPNGYKAPIPWPRSRDEVWFSNVPHTRLIDDKGGQNWITKMVPNVAFGSHTRVVLDVGCGVASFGAYLLSRDVLTLSIAPKDVHENQIQFALERGVPAMAAAFATRRWYLLLEVNRLLRAGGYFAWAAQPVYKHEEAQQEAWKRWRTSTARLCWEFVKKEGYIAMWRKPLNNSCYINEVLKENLHFVMLMITRMMLVLI
ncbi:dehydration-responsive protein-related [Zea mays]|uniref:Methyltransferase n=1 Tax=Zea mays TaxID=4577 RepID=A0A1D6G8I6_MAIZE|nr:dehydration-responsive protein-related [Zea mays]